MKQLLKQISAFLLALIVLFSSFSFTVNKHICGGEIASASLFLPADDCGMQMAVCENKQAENQDDDLHNEPCCKDVQEYIQGNQLEQQALDTFAVNQIDVLLDLIGDYTQEIATTVQVKQQEVIRYVPPNLLHKHTQAYLQVFRI